MTHASEMTAQLKEDNSLLEGEIIMENAKQWLSTLTLLALVPFVLLLAMLSDITGISATRQPRQRVYFR